MPRKLTHEFVAAQFALEGYQLLSEYVNANTHLQFICSNGHRHQITWGILVLVKDVVFALVSILATSALR